MLLLTIMLVVNVCLNGRNQMSLMKSVVRGHEFHFNMEIAYFLVKRQILSTRRKKCERKALNKKQKAINGNKTKEMKILAWNGGHTQLKNQMNEVRFLLQEKNPHLLFVSESNLLRSHDRDLVEVEGYSLHTTRMIKCPERQVSRLVAYVKEGIIARRREDLEVEDMSTIWLEIGLPKQRKFLVCGLDWTGPTFS